MLPGKQGFMIISVPSFSAYNSIRNQTLVSMKLQALCCVLSMGIHECVMYNHDTNNVNVKREFKNKLWLGHILQVRPQFVISR